MREALLEAWDGEDIDQASELVARFEELARDLAEKDELDALCRMTSFGCATVARLSRLAEGARAEKQDARLVTIDGLGTRLQQATAFLARAAARSIKERRRHA